MRVMAGFIAGLLLAAAPLGAQVPRLHMSVDTSVVSVGDRITLTVSVDHLPGAQVLWPDSLNLAPFEVLDAQIAPPLSQGERTRSSLALVLAAFELGELEVPSFDIQVRHSAGEDVTLPTDRYGIQVLSVGLDEGGGIREIKGPLGIPVNVAPFLLLLLAVVLGILLARHLYKRFRREHTEFRGTGPAAPWRPPHEVALEGFDRLERSPLLEQGKVKDYHIRASEIFRTYIERRFQVSALEMTTADIMPDLKMEGLEAPILDGFGRFLEGCDLVKFAKHRPDDDSSRAMLGLGRGLVQGTAKEFTADQNVEVDS